MGHDFYCRVVHANYGFDTLSTAGNVYSKYHRRRRFLQYNFMDPGWGGGRISYGGAGPPLVPALVNCVVSIIVAAKF